MYESNDVRLFVVMKNPLDTGWDLTFKVKHMEHFLGTRIGLTHEPIGVVGGLLIY